MLTRPALTDRQIARMAFRIGLFRRRGLPEREAEALADRLADRDYSGDTRRVCLECQHLQRGNTCFAASQGWLLGVSRQFAPITNLLQRCERFEFQTP